MTSSEKRRDDFFLPFRTGDFHPLNHEAVFGFVEEMAVVASIGTLVVLLLIGLFFFIL